jgi:hypothetical protein
MHSYTHLLAAVKFNVQEDSFPVRCSVGVLGNEKSTGDGGGAGVSSMALPEREELALKAALTSWPKVL